MCLDCDFTMCDKCFMIRHLRNPGHSIGRTIRAGLEESASSDAAGQNLFSEIPDLKNPIDKDRRPCCPTCLNYTPDFVNSNWSKSYEKRWSSNREPFASEFRESAARGCDICSVVHRGLLKAIPDDLADDFLSHLVIQRRDFLVSVFQRDPEFHELHVIRFRGMTGHPPRWSALRTEEALSRSLRDARCFDLIRKWLEKCDTTHDHPRCKRGADTALPRRVLRIQPALEEPRLHLTETNGATGRYIALSHCWGGFMGCRSTTANLTERAQGIKYRELPQTFKDAVYCALQLDVQFIWIDPLCIIQDDPQDWAQESAKMSQIYSDAYLVLAAASADADDKGFLTTPDVLERGVGLESQAGSGQDDIVMHRWRFAPDSDWSDGPKPNSGIDIGPLSTRAWTLQETLLARRCVGFNKRQIAWECHSLIDCERDHLHKAESSQKSQKDWLYVISDGLSGTVTRGLHHARPLTNLQDTSTFCLEWHLMLVPNYTRRMLTLAEDKLPAVSALASIIAKSSGDEYIAGLWRNDINIGLAWRSGHNAWKRTLLPSLTDLVAPSFSWASIDGPIDYCLPDPILQDGRSSYGSVGVTLLECSVPLSSSNPFGAVNGGWMRLSALAHSFSLAWEATRRQYMLTDKTDYQPHKLEFTPDTMLREITTQGSNGEHSVIVLRATSEDNLENWIQATVEGVLILDVPRTEGDSYEFESGSGYVPAHEVAILVLSPSSVNKKQFQRIGLATAVFKAGADVVQGWLGSAKRREFLIC